AAPEPRPAAGGVEDEMSACSRPARERSGRRADPSHPGLRLVDLLDGREVRRPLPDPVEAAHPDLANDLGHEPLPDVVLTDLGVEPDGTLEDLLDARPVA